MYKTRLYAAPAQAVFVTTPVALIIWELKGKIRYKRGTYWSRTINTRVLLVWSAEELLIAGIMNHMTIWQIKRDKKKYLSDIVFRFILWKLQTSQNIREQIMWRESKKICKYYNICCDYQCAKSSHCQRKKHSVLLITFCILCRNRIRDQ